MNGIRRSLGVVTAIALAAFALPGIAGPQKTYSFDADASGVSYDTVNGLQVLHVPAPVAFTIKNESPPSTANSNISSFTLTVAGVVITSVDNNACAAQGGTCSLDSNTNTVSVTGISPPIQAQGTFTVPLQVNSCGDGIWSAQVWTGSQLNGNTFAFVKDASLPTNTTTSVNCGDAGCAATFTVPNTLTLAGTPTYVTGTRGQYNKDGGACSTTAYTATNTIPTNNKLHFEWNASQAGATFRYTVTFQTAGTPQLAWFSDNAGPVFVDAQPCLVTQFQPLNLPAPYGNLAQAVNSSKNKIQVNVTTAPLSLPFPIIIDSERMLVTAIGTNWTVQRGQGGTAASSHAATAPVMSTPRPLLTGPFTPAQQAAGYKVGDQAHGCIAAPTDTSTWSTTKTFDIIDIDDIWSSGR